jgi:hypothetical protein
LCACGTSIRDAADDPALACAGVRADRVTAPHRRPPDGSYVEDGSFGWHGVGQGSDHDPAIARLAI